MPQDNLVAGDVVLAQKISRETDERGAWAVAKSFAPRRRNSGADPLKSGRPTGNAAPPKSARHEKGTASLLRRCDQK